MLIEYVLLISSVILAGLFMSSCVLIPLLFSWKYWNSYHEKDEQLDLDDFIKQGINSSTKWMGSSRMLP